MTPVLRTLRVAILLASILCPGAAFAQTWVGAGPDSAPLHALAASYWNPHVLYAATSLGLFRTTDGGAHWQPATVPVDITESSVTAVAVDPYDWTTVYAGTHERGMFKSTDGGNTWRPVNTGLTGFENVTVSVLTIDPWTPATIYASTAWLSKSTDGGETWTRMDTGISTVVQAIVIDPWRPSIVYAATNGRGVFKTLDGGQLWFPLLDGLQPDPLNGGSFPSAGAIAIDPWDPETVYFSDTRGPRLYKSANGGYRWEPIGTGVPLTRALRFDPVTPTTLLAASGSGGMSRSVDGGLTWSPINEGLTSRDILALIPDSSTPATLYAATRDRGVFKTTDGGQTWFAVNTGLRGSPVNDIAIDPIWSGVYIAGLGGVHESRNHGQS
jgi:photosystem II stability/assembly factor-like uncharacterized protein